MSRSFRIHVTWAIASGLCVLAAASGARAQDEKPITIAEIKRDEPVDFEKEVLPIFRRNCLACHNSAEAESDLVLETPQSILKGGAEGPAAVAGNSAESLLLLLTSRQRESFMPPDDNDVKAKRLTPQELGMIKLWIDQGAKGQVASAGGPLRWQPLPPGVNPTYAVAISPDGQYAAAGRANQIFIYHVPSRREIGRLTDPAILDSGAYSKPGVAHLDLVQSLRFSPDSRTLASGGYRNVKLWSRPAPRKADLQGLESKANAVAVDSSGKLAALGQDNGKILVVDLSTGKPAKTLAGHAAAVTDVQFTSDGAKIVSASKDKTFRAWDIASGAETSQVETPSEINALALLSEDSQLATGGQDNIIRIWQFPPPIPAKEEAAAEKKDEEKKEENAENAEPEKADDAPPKEEPLKPIREIPGHGQPVTSLAAINGGQLVSGSADGTVRHWNAADGKQLRQMNHGGPVESVAVRGDNGRIASASANNTVKLWDASDGKQLAELKGELYAKLNAEESTRLAALAKRKVDLAKADLKAAGDRKKSEEENAKKAEEAKTKAAEELAKKIEAAKKPVADKEAADKALADATVEQTKADEAKKQADAALPPTVEAENKAKADLDAKVKTAADAEKIRQDAEGKKKAADQAKVAADKAFADAQAKTKTAAEAQKNADQALADANAAKTKAEEAQKNAADEEAKKNADKALADAAAAQAKAEEAKKQADAALVAATESEQKAKADLDAKVKTAADAEKVRQDAEGKKKAADQAKTAADKVFADAMAKKKEAEQAKTNADKALADAQNKVKTADANAKKLADPAKKAVDEKNAADRALKAAERSVIRAGDSVKKAGEGVSAAEAAVKTAETRQQQDDSKLKEVQAAAAQTEKPFRRVVFSADGALLAAAGDAAVVQTFSSDTGAAVDTFTGQGAAITALAATPSGEFISAAANNSAVVWIGQPAWTLARTIGAPDSGEQLIDRVTALDFSPDGKLLATGGGQPSRSGELKIWNVENGSLVREIDQAHSDTIFSLEFSPEGGQIASSAADRFMKIFQVADGQFVRAFEGHTHHVLGVSWSSDGRTLATSGADQVVKVWDVNTGDQKRTISGFGKEVTSVNFMGDGEDVITSSGDNNVQAKRTSNGGNVRNFGGSTDFVHAAHVSADGKTIISGGQDSVLRIWSDNGQSVATFAPPQPEQTASASGGA